MHERARPSAGFFRLGGGSVNSLNNVFQILRKEVFGGFVAQSQGRGCDLLPPAKTDRSLRAHGIEN